MVQKIQDIIEAIGVPILVFNSALILKYYNKPALKLLPNIDEKLAAEAIFNNKTLFLL